MYQNKMVVALKVNGKILREFKDTVYVPFGAEYSILIKNLNSVRAAVDISIDGTDATEDVSLIVDANSELELSRYIKNGNLNSGNRFKFIERTSGIEQHRGIGIEDGIIRISFQYERVFTPTWISPGWNINQYGPMYINNSYGLNDVTCHVANTNAAQFSANSVSGCRVDGDDIVRVRSSSVLRATDQNETGITVPGSVSNQQFKQTSGFLRETEEHVMILKLLGETEQGKPVTQAVTVKSKPTCTTCGKVNKATAKFCSECGTSLQIV